MKPQFIIAAPSSNGGKTTVTLGMLRLLQKRGLQPQPFKCGPDYIDPKFHGIACDAQGINLDLIMMSQAHIQQRYAAKSESSRSVCVEGVMGLFDGAIKAKGSTAELAKLLAIPVVLVIDAKSVAYSVAPLIQGFKNFDPQVEIVGVIFNRVNTASHYQFLKEACADIDIPSLGRLPYLPACEIPSRHLGLSLSKLEAYDAHIDQIADALEEHVNIDGLLEVCSRPAPTAEAPTVVEHHRNLSIAVAKDEAFNFIYDQTITLFERMAVVRYFSPMHDSHLPEADFYYFPGGYPELYAEQLAANRSMLHDVRMKLPQRACLAECGGLMYLGKSIRDKEGKTHEMASVFDYQTDMMGAKLSLGYRKIRSEKLRCNGHEFHYSKLVLNNEHQEPLSIQSIRGREIATPVFRKGRCFATYIHLYFESVQEIEQLLKYSNEDLHEKRR